MSQSPNRVHFLLGKIEAVGTLAAALAAHTSPAILNAMLDQCAALRKKAETEGSLSDKEKGFLSIEDTLGLMLKQAADAEKMRELSGSASH